MSRRKKMVCIAVLMLLAAIMRAGPNWMFWKRAFTYPDKQITNVRWYRPLEEIRSQAEVPLAVATPEARQIPPAVIAQISDYAQLRNSCGLLILHEGKIVAEKYWQGHRADSLSNSMSMAKTVMALLIGLAIAEGKIGSDTDPAANYLEEWRNDNRRHIKIRDLLQMTSGLRCSQNPRNPFSDINQMHLGLSLGDYVLTIPAEQGPGQTFQYNNANTQILNVVLERATGKRYSDYLAEKLWQPLGNGPAYVWLDQPHGTAKVYGAIFATTHDWARLGLLLLNRGRVQRRQIVPEAWIAKMVAPSPHNSEYGYHVWLASATGSVRKKDRREPFAALDLFYLDGRAKQKVYVIPSRQLVIVRVGENAKEWDDSYLPNTLVRSLP